METAKYAEHAVASMKTNSNKMIHLLSVEKGAGINCILDDFEIDDPIVVVACKSEEGKWSCIDEQSILDEQPILEKTKQR